MPGFSSTQTSSPETLRRNLTCPNKAELRARLANKRYRSGDIVTLEDTNFKLVIALDNAGNTYTDDTGTVFCGSGAGSSTGIGDIAALKIVRGTIYSNWFDDINYFFNYQGADIAFLVGNNNYDNSAGPLTLQSNTAYIGLGRASLNFLDETQRLLLVQNKSNFSIENIKTTGNTESMETSLGGGYWRFENCSDFFIRGGGVSNHGWDGIKLVECSDFRISKTKCNYGKSTAITAEGCTDFQIYDNDLSKNGRNSSDDSYADLPTGWSGTHIGRGVTLVSTSGGVQCERFEVKNNRCMLNSEYGIRSFAQAPLIGNKDGVISENKCTDNGHPAGTYGTVVLASDKGTDILINADPAGTTQDMIVSNNKVIRETLGFGTCIAVGGERHFVQNNKCYLRGSALHLVEALLVFSADKLELKENKSYGANEHIVIGSGVSDLTIDSDVARDCVKFKQGSPSSGENLYKDCKGYHRAAVAVSNDLGLDLSTDEDATNNFMGGFYYGISISGSHVGRVIGNKTQNSANAGLRNFSINNSASYINNNDFDSVNPFDKSGMVGESATPRGASVGWSYSIPTTGYYKRGTVIYDSQPGAPSGGRLLIGWFRLTSGSSHVLGTDWEQIIVDIT